MKHTYESPHRDHRNEQKDQERNPRTIMVLKRIFPFNYKYSILPQLISATDKIEDVIHQNLI